MKLAMINAKGGTAKTTTAVNLAHALTMRKLKVLLCDLDPQASASLSLGFQREALHPSIAEVLIKSYPIQKAIRKTSVERLDLLTSSMSLSNFDIYFASKKGREHQLRDTLSQINGYDIIILDCPPTLSLLPINALIAADCFIVPVIPQYLALEGLATLTEAIDRIKAGMNCQSSLMGIILTQVDNRSKATEEIIHLVRKHYGDSVFKTEVRVNTRLAEAPSFGKTIFQHDGCATGAQAYRALAKEVLKRMKQKEARHDQEN